MEILSDDVLGLVLERVSISDRKSCSQVSTLWFKIEAQTRTRVRVLDSEHLPNFLPRFPNLNTLVVDVGISDQSLMLVAECCPLLRTLDLNLNLDLPDNSEFPDDFGDEGLEAVARGCRHLVEVKLSARNIGDNGVIALQKYAKGLAVLDLWHCVLITDMSLAAIGDMESLSELHFMGCKFITDSGLNLLSSGPCSRTLRVLTVYSCKQITDAGIFHLRRMSCLEDLNLSWCHEVTDVGGVAVSALSNLKRLYLSVLPAISDETLFALAKGCRNLVEINLVGCQGITGRGVVSLASSLPLKYMELQDCCELSSDHVMQILERCHSLRLLIVDTELEEGLSPSQREKLLVGLGWNLLILRNSSCGLIRV